MQEIDQNQAIEALERKNMVKSAVATITVNILLLLLGIFWIAAHGTIPPPGEKLYQVVGGIDFGNRSEGSSAVDNFNDPSPNPSENPNSENSMSSSSQTERETRPENEKVVSSDNTSETSVNKKEEEKTNSETGKQQSKQKTTGGSNEGKTQNTGNDGDPDSRQLDQNGLYNFEFGPGLGSGGRKCINCDEPPEGLFTTDGNLQVEFCIDSEGNPFNIVPQATANRDQKLIVMRWLKERKFNDDPSTDKQCSNIVVRFRLK